MMTSRRTTPRNPVRFPEEPTPSSTPSAPADLNPRLQRVRERVAAEAEFKGMEKMCPNCGKTKDIVPYFGLSRSAYDGKYRPNGWCTQCRNQPKREARIQAAKTPKFSAAFLEGMNAKQRARYVALYNEIAAELGRTKVKLPGGD